MSKNKEIFPKNYSEIFYILQLSIISESYFYIASCRIFVKYLSL